MAHQILNRNNIQQYNQHNMHQLQYEMQNLIMTSQDSIDRQGLPSNTHLVRRHQVLEVGPITGRPVSMPDTNSLMHNAMHRFEINKLKAIYFRFLKILGMLLNWVYNTCTNSYNVRHRFCVQENDLFILKNIRP